MSVEQLKTELRWRLTKLRPTPAVIQMIASVDDIFANRSHLREARCTPNDLRHLLDLVLSALSEGRRFRQMDCLKVLKRIIKQWPSHHGFPPNVTDRLFRLYMHYIYSASEQAHWAVSVMLKGRILRNQQVLWLIEHYQESDHILNRLLRYPRRHPFICAWARKILDDSSALPERRSELLGLLIDHSIPRIALKESSKIVAWAIYYSAAPDKTKVQLLKRALDLDNFWDIVKIAERCDYPNVIKHILKEVEQAA